jgi:hypothetical protein
LTIDYSAYLSPVYMEFPVDVTSQQGLLTPAWHSELDHTTGVSRGQGVREYLCANTCSLNDYSVFWDYVDGFNADGPLHAGITIVLVT